MEASYFIKSSLSGYLSEPEIHQQQEQPSSQEATAPSSSQPVTPPDQLEILPPTSPSSLSTGEIWQRNYVDNEFESTMEAKGVKIPLGLTDGALF